MRWATRTLTGQRGLDPGVCHYGNSVKGQKVARFLAARLGMDLLISTPTEEPAHVKPVAS
jgi:hypothetical protein